MKSCKSITVYLFLAGLIAALPSLAQARGATGHMGLHPLGSAIHHHHAAACEPDQACGQAATRP
jgi:hypothetical protein